MARANHISNLTRLLPVSPKGISCGAMGRMGLARRKNKSAARLEDRKLLERVIVLRRASAVNDELPAQEFLGALDDFSIVRQPETVSRIFI